MNASTTIATDHPEIEGQLPQPVTSSATRSSLKRELLCRFCGSKNLAPAFTFPDQQGRATEIHLCRECNCLVPRFDLDSSRSAILRLQTDFWEAQWPDMTATEAQQLAADCACVGNYYAPWLKPEGGPVLELGAGRGGLMEAMRRQGFTVLGCEPAGQLTRLARKAFGFDEQTLHHAEAEIFLKWFRRTGQKAQVVFLWHVLEHIPEPYPLLRQIAGILNDRGLLIGQVPLLDREYVYETHLAFLSEPALHHAARQCGFTVEQFNYDIERRYMAFILKKNQPATPRGPFELDLSSVVATAPLRAGETKARSAQAGSKPDEQRASMPAPATPPNDHEKKAPAGDIAAVRKELELAPKSPALWQALGEACCDAKQLAEAREAFAKAVALAPGESLLWVKLALVQRELNQIAGAEESLNRALRIDPNHELALRQLGLTLLARCQFEEALRLFWRLEKLNSQSVEAILLGANCQFEIGDHVAARLNYFRVLKLDSENAEAKKYLAAMGTQCPTPPPSETATILEISRRAAPLPSKEDVLKREFPCPNPFSQLYIVPRAKLDLRFCSYHRPVLFGDQDIVFREGIGALDALLNGHPQFVARRDRFLAGDYNGAGCSENCIWFNKWKTTGKGFTLGEHLTPDGKFKLGKIWLSMGPDCNVSCRYCLEPSEFSVDFNTCDPKVMVLARDFVRRGGELLFTGGETFLPKWGFAKALEELVNWGDAKGVIGLHTNGTYLNEKNRDLLLRGPVTSVGISMDTLRKDLYEYLRRGTKFDLVWGNATALAREKQARKLQAPAITILCAVMKSTASHLVETVDRAIEAGLGISLNALFQSSFSPAFSAKEGLHNLSLAELEKLHQDVLHIERNHGPGGWVNCAGFKGQVENQLERVKSGRGEKQVVLGGGGHAPRLPHFAHVEVVEQLVAQQQFAEARKKIEPLREKAKRSTRFLHVLADIECGENNLSAAAGCYDQILTLDPRDQKALDFRKAHPEVVAGGIRCQSLPVKCVEEPLQLLESEVQAASVLYRQLCAEPRWMQASGDKGKWMRETGNAMAELGHQCLVLHGQMAEAHAIAGHLPQTKPLGWMPAGLQDDLTVMHFRLHRLCKRVKAEHQAHSTGRRFFCKALSGMSNYNISINSDMTVSCNCQDYFGEGLIGDLKQQSFKEVWFGSKAQFLRDELAQGRLPLAQCGVCNELASTQNVGQAARQASAPAFPKRGIMVENTSVCGVDCIGCRKPVMGVRRKSMSLDDFARALEVLREHRMDRLAFLNLGEPFLPANVLEQMKFVRRVLPNIEILTSTSGLCMDTDDRIEAALMMDILAFSIDGIDQESVSVYQRRQNFDKSFKSMARLVKIRDERGLQKPKIYWKYVLFKWNESREQIDTAMQMSREAGVDALHFWNTDWPFWAVPQTFHDDNHYPDAPIWKDLTCVRSLNIR